MPTKILAYSFTIICMLAVFACTSTKIIDKDEEWSFELTLEGCMDVCQAYSITIKNDGEYAYLGKFKVKHLGKKTGQIDGQMLPELKKLIADIAWKSLPSTYDKPGQGSERKLMKYNSNSINKEITYSRLEPKELRVLENFIHTLIDQDDF